MKHSLMSLLLLAGLTPAALPAQQTQDSLAENVTFYCSFDDSVEPDQSRGSDKIIVGNFDKSRFEFIPGVKGKAVLGKNNPQSLRFKIQDNVDFSKPGSVSLWFNPVDWIVQTKDTPNHGNTQWKKTYYNSFFATSFMPTGYIVLQRTTSHVPGGKDVLMLVFPCFKDITKSNVRLDLDLGKNVWHHLAMTWDGLNYVIYLDGKERLRTSVPYKVTSDKLADCFGIGMSSGLAFDEFTLYDKVLSAEEIAGLYKKDNPVK